MTTYTVEQIQAGIAKAQQQGNMEMVNRLSALLNTEAPAVSDSVSTYSVEQIKAGIAKAEKLGNQLMVNKLTALYENALREDEDPASPTSAEYIANQAKLGITDSASQISAGLLTAEQSRQVTGPLSIGGLITGGLKAAYEGDLGKTFVDNLTGLQKMFGKVTGADPEMELPEDAGVVTQLAGAAARMAADPLSYTGIGVATKLKKGIIGTKATKETSEFVGTREESLKLLNDVVKPVASRAIQVGSFGAVAEGGGAFGGAIERASSETGEETGAGRLIGSILAAPLAAKSILIKQAGKAGADVGKQLWNKVKDFRRDPTAATEAYASGAVKGWLKDAASNVTRGDFKTILSEYKKLEPILAKIDVDGTPTKINFPLLAAMAENPVIRQTVAQLVSTNPKARTIFTRELNKVSESLGNRLKDVFGERYATLRTKEPGLNVEAINKRIVQVSDKLGALKTQLKPTQSKEQRGKQIRTLVEARKNLAKQEAKKKYTQLIKEATEAGANLPKENVQQLHTYVRLNKIEDLFGKETKIGKAVFNKLKPRQKIKVVNGEAIPVTDDQGRIVKVYPTLSFKQVDSLKRAINDEMRVRTPGSQEHRKLSQFKEIFDETRSSIKGDFNKRLQALDTLYYEKIGVPFGSQGIKDIDAKKYAEQVAPVIINKTESLQNFYDAVGPEGVKIARNTFLSDVYYKEGMFKDGVLDRKRLMMYMEEKEDIINMIPGLRKELTGILVNQEGLSMTVASLDKAATAANLRAVNDFLNLEPGVPPNYQQIAKEIQKDPKKLDQYFAKMKDLSPEGAETIRNAIRREVVYNAIKRPEGMRAYLEDVANKHLLTKLFGTQRLGYMKKFAKLSDAVERLDIDKISQKVAEAQYDAVAQVVPGLNIPYITSQIRDKIASLIQKGVRLFTRVQEAVAKEKIQEAQIDILTNPDSLENAMRAADIYNLGITNPMDAEKFIRSFAEAAPLYFYAATKANLPQEEQ